MKYANHLFWRSNKALDSHGLGDLLVSALDSQVSNPARVEKIINPLAYLAHTRHGVGLALSRHALG